MFTRVFCYASMSFYLYISVIYIKQVVDTHSIFMQNKKYIVIFWDIA